MSDAIAPADRRERFALVGALLLAMLAWGYLRIEANTEWREATWEQLFHFSAPRPFGERVLVPLLAQPLVRGTSLELRIVVELFEALSFGALLCVLFRFFRRDHSRGQSVALVAGFVAVLPWLFLVGGHYPFLYPYDTPAMLFTALGLACIVERRFAWAVVVIAFGALNRETSVWLVGVALVLWLGRLPARQVLGWSAAMLAVFALVRGGVRLALPDLEGESIRWMLGQRLRVVSNLRWLREPRHVAATLSYLAFLPLAWWWLRRSIPEFLSPLKFVAFAQFLALLVVGNVDEPRIYGEVVLLLYVPLAYAATSRALGRAHPLAPAPSGVFAPVPRWLERYGFAALLAAWLLSVLTLVARFEG